MIFFDRVVKVILRKVFGTSNPKLITFSTSENDDKTFYDPYFESFTDSNGKVLLKPRDVPSQVPLELQSDILGIKSTCYWMDESLLGIKSSALLNKLFGAKDIKIMNNQPSANANVISDTNPITKSLRSRRIGFGFAPIIQIIPVIGNYISLLINIWIIYGMFQIGLGYKLNVHIARRHVKFELNKIRKSRRFLNIKNLTLMIFNILVDFGIGFVPFAGLFVTIIHRSSSRNLAIFWESMDEQYKKRNNNGYINNDDGS